MIEEEFQQLVVNWLDNALPNGSLYHHSPNEGQRHVSFKIKLKKLGMKAGWCDLEIYVPGKHFHNKTFKPIFIELKSPTGKGKLSPFQESIQEQLKDIGCHVLTANKLDTVIFFLNDLITLRDNGNRAGIEKWGRMVGA